MSTFDRVLAERWRASSRGDGAGGPAVWMPSEDGGGPMYLDTYDGAQAAKVRAEVIVLGKMALAELMIMDADFRSFGIPVPEGIGVIVEAAKRLRAADSAGVEALPPPPSTPSR